MDTDGFVTPTEMLMSLMLHELDATPKHQQIKEFRGFE